MSACGERDEVRFERPGQQRGGAPTTSMIASCWDRLKSVLRSEIGALHLRLLLGRALLAPVPLYTGNRFRVFVLRLVGFTIGPDSVMWGTPTITGQRNLYQMLTIGRGLRLNVGCFFDAGGAITIGDGVAIGQEVMILTSSHEIGTSGQRIGELYAKGVTIGPGAWLGTRCTILPGVNIGAGAIVAAGAVVNRDVPPNTLVAGVPARVIKRLPISASVAAPEAQPHPSPYFPLAGD